MRKPVGHNECDMDGCDLNWDCWVDEQMEQPYCGNHMVSEGLWFTLKEAEERVAKGLSGSIDKSAAAIHDDASLKTGTFVSDGGE